MPGSKPQSQTMSLQYFSSLRWFKEQVACQPQNIDAKTARRDDAVWGCFLIPVAVVAVIDSLECLEALAAPKLLWI